MISIILLSANLLFAQGQNAARANANLEPKSGSQVRGFVAFDETPRGLKVVYEITGLKSNGTFGFHIHEQGNCTSDDGKSAGGHFAKVSSNGGTSLEFPDKYAGDLPELRSDASGRASGYFLSRRLNLNEGPTRILGRSVVVHAGPDNPRAHSAPRIACGVIRGEI